MTFEQKRQEVAAMPTATLIDRLENFYLFECEGGGITNCVEWVELKARLLYGATRSVLRDWVMALPLREQGTLIVGLRGCDSAPKFPLDSPERRVTAALRYAVCVPADEREVDSEPGCFMISDPPMDVKLSMFEHYPQHWVGHIIHACEVLGYRHPDHEVRRKWFHLYIRFCRSLHLPVESATDMGKRLSEDRIASQTVVSL